MRPAAGSASIAEAMISMLCSAAKNQVNREKSRDKRGRKQENRFIQEQLRWVRNEQRLPAYFVQVS